MEWFVSARDCLRLHAELGPNAHAPWLGSKGDEKAIVGRGDVVEKGFRGMNYQPNIDTAIFRPFPSSLYSCVSSRKKPVVPIGALQADFVQ